MEKNDASIKLLIMQLKSEAEDIYLSKGFKEKIIKETVKTSLDKALKENKISSTEYQKALDILNKN